MAALVGWMCACGRSLHYSNGDLQRQVELLVQRFGPDVLIQVDDRWWSVQRHYIALHGIKASELPKLGFPEVTEAMRQIEQGTSHE